MCAHCLSPSVVDRVFLIDFYDAVERRDVVECTERVSLYRDEMVEVSCGPGRAAHL